MIIMQPGLSPKPPPAALVAMNRVHPNVYINRAVNVS